MWKQAEMIGFTILFLNLVGQTDKKSGKTNQVSRCPGTDSNSICPEISQRRCRFGQLHLACFPKHIPTRNTSKNTLATWQPRRL